MSGIPMMHQHFDLLLEGVVRVGYPCYYRRTVADESESAFVERLARELEEIIQREGPDTVAAFIAEPVQGAGGVIVPPPGYFERAHRSTA
jgi:4-aminobutyrate--pyruvate transaminase